MAAIETAHIESEVYSLTYPQFFELLMVVDRKLYFLGIFAIEVLLNQLLIHLHDPGSGRPVRPQLFGKLDPRSYIIFIEAFL